jgi:hypothetical protein
MLGLFDVAYGDGRNFFRQLKSLSRTSGRNHRTSTKRGRSRAQKLIAAFATAALSGCSVHPIPDDLPPGIPTEEIVKSARCEMRLGLFDQVKRLLREEGIADFDVSVLQTQQGRKAVLPNPPPQLKTILAEYGEVAVAYDFNFEISEHDNLDASLAFKLPFTAPNVFDLGAAGSLRKTRIGKRTFSSQETFYDLILRDQWCGNFEPRDRNLAYPITGSIGLRKVVETFMVLSEQGGGKDSFVDALTFTTTISGSVNPSVKLNPVPDSFRLVNASAGFSADRTDLHQVKISLAFPVSAKPKKKKNERPAQPDDPNGPSIAPYAYNPVWRARYNICVADARDREDTFKTLRLSPPEVYCLSYADAFVPRTYAEALLSRSDFDRGQPRPDLDAPAPRRGPEPPLPRSRSLESPLPRATEPPSPQPRSKSWW